MNNRLTIYCGTIFCLLMTVNTAAQVNVYYSYTDSVTNGQLKSAFSSYDELEVYLSTLARSKRDEGYLSFSVDSMITTGDSLTIHLFQGNRFSNESGNIEQRRILNEVRKMEDAGYPFATVQVSNSLDSLSIRSRSKILLGPLIRFDSLILLQSPDLPAKILGYHLGIRYGQPYSESLIDNADKRLRQLPFIRLVRPTSVIFTSDKSRVLLALEKRNANQVDGIVGFQPDADGKVSFTGELELDLHNSFSHLDRIYLLWQRVADNTQRIEFNMKYPYMFSTSFGLRAGIEQFRQDTTFNQIKLNAGLFSVLDNGAEFTIFYQSSSVNDIQNIDNTDGSSTSSGQYGLSYEMKDLNDLFNPTKGYRVLSSLSYGDKEVRPTDIEMPSVNVEQWIAKLLFENYFPIWKRSTVLLRARAEHIESDVIIFNELERIGGLHTLRGADEQSIRASSYGILTSEFRLLTDERSYLSAFIDYAWYQQMIDSSSLQDNPYGVGVGAAFATGSGVLNINYALGSQFGQPLSFSTGKVHFGYTALF